MDVLENRRTIGDCYRVNHKLILVNKTVVGEQAGDRPTAQNGHILAGRFFDFAYLRHNITADNSRVFPGRFKRDREKTFFSALFIPAAT